MKREGFTDNYKRVCRIYKGEGLNLRTKRPRRNRAGAHRLERLENNCLNKIWSMDFVQDALFNGIRFRILSIVDNYSEKCLNLTVGQSLKGRDVVDQLEQLKLFEGLIHERIKCDNRSEFISKEVDKWAYENEVTLYFSRPGKPTDNPYVESFNGKLRDECLSVNWSLLLEDTSNKINSWKEDYNSFRPHSSLNDLTLVEFIILQSNKLENFNFNMS